MEAKKPVLAVLTERIAPLRVRSRLRARARSRESPLFTSLHRLLDPVAASYRPLFSAKTQKNYVT
jgi:hypothetical protein